MSPKVTEEYKEERKKEILKAAFEVFCKKGFEPTTMKDIVDASGLSRGGVYQYYSSTEEMFRDIIDRNDKVGREELSKVVGASDSVWKVIKDSVNGYREVPTTNFAIVQFEFAVISWRSDSEDRFDYILNRLKFWRKNLVDLINEGVKRGEFHPVQKVEAIVDFMTNVFDGLILHHHLAGASEIDVDGQVDALLFYLKNVLQVKED
ncbi:TetR family transcriptional regulator [Bacillus luteolus]|uniref:TetR family transcriptional regulator n=1 Tax=Litchfieldia luteola TaxID=682179 RepID=A0ABR9QP72_9BACI|nr:TetR family transcriptional regulator [Cytobacillus luteolus]MBE4909974.1 TetR family transcriptional regulator [Cytobacillus luteolus]MBP1942469.1 AcrR family transcriptional regulator [Cytobacillus luteolus]